MEHQLKILESFFSIVCYHCPAIASEYYLWKRKLLACRLVLVVPGIMSIASKCFILFVYVCARARMFVYVCALLYERQRTTLGNPFSPFILHCARVFCVSASLRTQDELALKLLGKLISPLQSQKECIGYGCTWLHLASCVCPGA